MKRMRHQHHYAVRAAKQNDNFMLRKQRLAEACDGNDKKDMWRELKP